MAMARSLLMTIIDGTEYEYEIRLLRANVGRHRVTGEQVGWLVGWFGWLVGKAALHPTPHSNSPSILPQIRLPWPCLMPPPIRTHDTTNIGTDY